MSRNADPIEQDTWAADLARCLLEPLGDRWAHTQAVAGCARQVGKALPVVERRVLEAAAYLHDIGYAPGVVTTGHHAIDGARHLQALGHDRLARLVAHHSSSGAEAELRGLAADLAAFPAERSPVADALTYCDLTSGPTGLPVSLEERLADVERRYGPEHVVVRGLRAAAPMLERAVAATERRVAAADVSTSVAAVTR